VETCLHNFWVGLNFNEKNPIILNCRNSGGLAPATTLPLPVDGNKATAKTQPTRTGALNNDLRCTEQKTTLKQTNKGSVIPSVQ
jgi:hypothetical protein